MGRIIYFIRHAQSLDNANKRRGGDSDLTKKGRIQAAKVADYFSRLYPDEIFKVIYTSKKRRAVNTSYIIRDMLSQKYMESIESIDFDVSVIEDDALSEQNYGKSEGEDERKSKRGTAYEKLNNAYEGGESGYDVLKRVLKFSENVPDNGDPLIIVSHTNPLRSLSYLYSKDIYREDAMFLPWDNCEVRKIDTGIGSLEPVDI